MVDWKGPYLARPTLATERFYRNTKGSNPAYRKRRLGFLKEHTQARVRFRVTEPA